MVVDEADAAEWVARQLATRPVATDAPHVTVVMHSLFMQYPPAATRAAITAAIERYAITLCHVRLHCFVV